MSVLLSHLWMKIISSSGQLLCKSLHSILESKSSEGTTESRLIPGRSPIPLINFDLEEPDNIHLTCAIESAPPIEDMHASVSPLALTAKTPGILPIGNSSS